MSAESLLFGNPPRRHFICFSKRAVTEASSPAMMKNAFSLLDFSVSHSWKEINAAITEAINVGSSFPPNEEDDP